MKNSLKMLLGVSIIALSLVSCSKGDAPGGPGDGGTNPPPPVPSPTVSVNVPAGKAWYNDSIVITYSSANADAVIINNTKKPASGTYTVYSVTQAQNLSFQAIHTGNSTSSTVNTVSVDSYSQRETFLCKPSTNDIWRNIEVLINGIGSPACRPWKFRENGTYTYFRTECGLPGGDSNGTWSISGNSFRVSNLNYTIVSMTENKIVLTIVNNIGQLVQETYTR